MVPRQIRYFNKKCSDLTVSESAVIAAIAQSPTYNNPIDYPDINAQRRDKILNNMLTLGLITQQQYDEAKADDVYSRITEVNKTTKSKDIIYTWFEDAAIDQVLNDLQEKLGYTSAEANNALYSGGLQIYLTQSRHIQDIVDSYYNDDDNFPSTEYRLHWAIMALMTVICFMTTKTRPNSLSQNFLKPRALLMTISSPRALI